MVLDRLGNSLRQAARGDRRDLFFRDVVGGQLIPYSRAEIVDRDHARHVCLLFRPLPIPSRCHDEAAFAVRSHNDCGGAERFETAQKRHRVRRFDVVRRGRKRDQDIRLRVCHRVAHQLDTFSKIHHPPPRQRRHVPITRLAQPVAGRNSKYPDAGRMWKLKGNTDIFHSTSHI